MNTVKIEKCEKDKQDNLCNQPKVDKSWLNGDFGW